MSNKKNKIIGIIGTLSIHFVFFSFLYMFYIRLPEKQIEGGVPVFLGNVEFLQGEFIIPAYTEVSNDEMNIRQEHIVSSQESEDIIKEEREEMITQTNEFTTVIPSIKERDSNSLEKKKKQVLKSQLEKERETKKKTDQRIAGAFDKGLKMGNIHEKGAEKNEQGDPEGNLFVGESTGVGGYGTFDLNGRSLEEGGLPRPIYNVQDEGRVVVTITVNPAGAVINVSINKRTNTVNVKLQNAALEAAKKACFNRIEGVDNQTGTITYYFKLK